MVFRNPWALSSALAALRTLQPRALGFLNTVDPLDTVSNCYVTSVVSMVSMVSVVPVVSVVSLVSVVSVVSEVSMVSVVSEVSGVSLHCKKWGVIRAPGCQISVCHADTWVFPQHSNVKVTPMGC